MVQHDGRRRAHARRLAILIPLLAALAACRGDGGSPPSQPDARTLLESEVMRMVDECGGELRRQAFLLPDAGDYDALPQDPRNPITAEKVALGALLFHEPALLVRNVRAEGHAVASCATCHVAAAGFFAGIPQGIGEGGSGFGLSGEARVRDTAYADAELDVQQVRPPSSLNVAFQPCLGWMGQFGAVDDNLGTEAQWLPGTGPHANTLGYHGAESIAIAALANHRLTVERHFAGASPLSEEVTANPVYQELFRAAFPGVSDAELFTSEHAGLAIAAYLRSKVADRAPFQRWLRGQSGAMTTRELRGARLFFGKAGCVECHNGPSLAAMTFHALGVADFDEADPRIHAVDPGDPAHRGRGGFTGNPEDEFRFKVPQLYNLADAPFYGHGASFRSIRDVIAYKNRAVPQNPRVTSDRLDPLFVPLGLSEEEIDDLEAFLAHALRDPHLERYVPDELPTGLPFPNNDRQSRQDMGVDDPVITLLLPPRLRPLQADPADVLTAPAR